MSRRSIPLSRRALIRTLLLVLLLVYLMALALPFVAHHKVSQTFRDNFATRTFLSPEAGPERVAYIDDNLDALLFRLRLIESAQEELILSTLNFDDDTAGTDVLAALLDAAQRGVRIRIVIDGISGFLQVRSSPLFQALAVQETVEIRLYNPVNLLKPWTLQARLHDKYIISDRTAYLLGGRNNNDLFIGNYVSNANIDRELLVVETGSGEDTSLDQLATYFSQVWDLPECHTFRPSPSPKKLEESLEILRQRYQDLHQRYPQAFQPWDWTQGTVEANRISLLTNPTHAGNKEPWMWYALCQLMSQGKQVTMYTPYIICGPEMYQDITGLSENGLHLEIITNHVASGANPWGCSDYLNQKEKIRRTGAQIYECMGDRSFHTKALVIDDRVSILGSYNLDMKSTYQDTELMLVVDSPALNQILRTDMEADKARSRTMGPDGDYISGPDYVHRELPWNKKLLYSLLRVVTLPLRRFL